MGTTLPQNVANICNWTHMCMTGGGNPNIHTTDYGHSLIAKAYEKLLRVPPQISGVLPAAAVGSYYSFQFTVAGFPAAKVGHVGSLPKGLKLSKTGLLSGTPKKAGSYPLTVKASNSGGAASEMVTITVS